MSRPGENDELFPALPEALGFPPNIDRRSFLKRHAVISQRR